GGDNTVIAAVGTVIAIGRRLNVPVFSVLPGAPDRGTVFDVGPNFYEVGRLGGGLVADVLEGADLTKIPVRDVMDVAPSFLVVNTTVLKGVKAPCRAPDALLSRADIVADETGVRKKAAPAAADARPLTKQWKLGLIQFSRLIDSEEAEAGVLDGLKESGLVE